MVFMWVLSWVLIEFRMICIDSMFYQSISNESGWAASDFHSCFVTTWPHGWCHLLILQNRNGPNINIESKFIIKCCSVSEILSTPNRNGNGFRNWKSTKFTAQSTNQIEFEYEWPVVIDSINLFKKKIWFYGQFRLPIDLFDSRTA